MSSLLPRLHVDAPRHVVDLSKELWPISPSIAERAKTTQVSAVAIAKIAQTSSPQQHVDAQPDKPESYRAKVSAWVQNALDGMRMTPEQEAAHLKVHPPLSASEKAALKTGLGFTLPILEFTVGGAGLATLKVINGLENAITFTRAVKTITPTNAAQSYKLLNSEYRKQLAELKQNPFTRDAERAKLKEQRNTAVASIKDQLLLSGHGIERGQVKPFASHADAVASWMRLGANEDAIASRYLSGVTLKNIDDRIAAATTTQHNMARHSQALYRDRLKTPNYEAQRDTTITIWNGTDKALTQLRNLKAEWNKSSGSK